MAPITTATLIITWPAPRAGTDADWIEPAVLADRRCSRAVDYATRHARGLIRSGLPTQPITRRSQTAYAPGELVTFMGTSASLLKSRKELPISTTLGGVQVFVNGQAAPVYLVSENQISALIPYESCGRVFCHISGGRERVEIQPGYRIRRQHCAGDLHAIAERDWRGSYPALRFLGGNGQQPRQARRDGATVHDWSGSSNPAGGRWRGCSAVAR